MQKKKEGMRVSIVLIPDFKFVQRLIANRSIQGKGFLFGSAIPILYFLLFSTFPSLVIEVSHLFFLLRCNQSVQSRLVFSGIACLFFPTASCYMASIANKAA